MASRTATLTVKVLVDAAQAAAGTSEAVSGFDKLQGSVSKLTPLAMGAAVGLAAAGKVVTDSASRQQQAMGAVDSVFQDNASTIKAWADTAATAVGLSKAEYGEFASVLGAQFNNLGVSAEQASGNTNDLITLGADLAATFGGTTTDAVSALSSALRGEADPAERYGLALNQTQINAYLAAKGLDGLTGEALTAAKAQAVVDLATQQAGGALGQFARETDTAAGSQQIANAKWEDAKAALGEGLLPALTNVTTTLGGMAQWVGENSGLVMTLAGVIGGLAAGVLALNVGLKIYQATTLAISAATKVWTGIQAAFNLVMAANPVALIVIAVIALVAAIILAYQKCEWFRDAVDAIAAAIASAWTATWNAIKTAVSAVVDWITQRWNQFKAGWDTLTAALGAGWAKVWGGIKSVAEGVLAVLLSPIHAIQTAFDAVSTAISSVISWIKKIKWPEPPAWLKSIGSGIGSIFSFSAATASAPAMRSLSAAPAVSTFAATPSVVGRIARATARAATPTDGGTNIPVTGAMDPDAVARQIERLLTRRRRRVGGVTIGG